MKEIEVGRILHDCTAQLYFDAIYATDAAMRAFHAKINYDDRAVVGPWNAPLEGSRTVQFVMPMNVPAMLKKFIGLDSVPVLETQSLEWLIPGQAFRVVSEPLLNFPGANKFTTSGFLEVRSLQEGTSCQVKAIVRCSAAMPWPVQATVEGLMATEAAQSLGTFIDFCQQFYDSWRADQLLQPERPAASATATAAGAAAGAAAAAGGEQFYDALEDESELRSVLEEGETSVVPYEPPRLEDIIVDCLRQIQASSTETARTLRNLEELLRNMDDNMQVLRDKLVGRRPPPRATASSTRQQQRGPGSREVAANTATTTSYTGTTTETMAPAAASAPTSATSCGFMGGGDSSSSPFPYIGFLATASLVCGAGAFVYVRYRLGTSGGSGN